MGEKISHFFVCLKKVTPYYFIIVIFYGIFNLLLNQLVDLGRLEKTERLFFTEFNFINISLSFIGFGIILPILEEFSFRGNLTKNEKQIKIGISFLIIICISKILELFITINFWLDLFFCFIFGWFLALKIAKISLPLKLFYKNRLFFLIISSIVFALFHLGLNYNSSNLLFLLISIIPFFFSGFIFGIVVLRYGIFYSIGLHVLINITGLLINLYN